MELVAAKVLVSQISTVYSYADKLSKTLQPSKINTIKSIVEGSLFYDLQNHIREIPNTKNSINAYKIKLQNIKNLANLDPSIRIGLETDLKSIKVTMERILEITGTKDYSYERYWTVYNDDDRIQTTRSVVRIEARGIVDLGRKLENFDKPWEGFGGFFNNLFSPDHTRTASLVYENRRKLLISDAIKLKADFNSVERVMNLFSQKLQCV